MSCSLEMIAITAGLGMLIVISSYLRARRRRRSSSTSSKSFPPGPPGIPILGNLLQIPADKSCVEFQKWSRKYGGSSDGLLGLRLGPWSKMIILNKDRQVRDLLEARATVYAGRGPVAVMDSMRSWLQPGEPFAGNFALAQYDDELKRARRASTEHLLRSGQVEKLLPIQEAESTQLAWELLGLEDKEEDENENENQHQNHDQKNKTKGPAAAGSHVVAFYRMFGAVMLAAVYGIRGRDSTPESPLGMFASIVEEFIPLLALTSAPPLDILPAIVYLPDMVNPWRAWMARAKQFARRWQSFWTEFHRLGLETAARKTSREGDGVLARLQHGKAFSDSEILTFGSTMMNAGADTTAVTCLSIIAALVNHPDLQDRARAEVDALFGEATMPSANKLNNMTFLKACFYEAIRWRPLTPLMTRKVRQDHIYDGFLIPEGTTVLYNIWAMSQDSDVFEQPDQYMPARYLPQLRGDSGVKPLPVYGFGSGLRSCPGQKMAEYSIMLVMAKILWLFEVTAPRGKIDTSVETGYDDSFLMTPVPVKLRFRLRSEARGELLRREWKRADEWLSRFE